MRYTVADKDEYTIELTGDRYCELLLHIHDRDRSTDFWLPVDFDDYDNLSKDDEVSVDVIRIPKERPVPELREALSKAVQS